MPATMNKIYTTLTANFSPKISVQNLEGREHMVIPTVMMTEGVHNGSKGPIYYSREFLASKDLSVWNHIPVIVYHPVDNGEEISARNPSVLDSSKVGLLFNTFLDEDAWKWRTETWLDKNRADVVDERVSLAIDNEETVEVSTGLYLMVTEEEGVWNGEQYKFKAHDYIPDHLAILPDGKGACSVADGAGLFQLNRDMSSPITNETSYNNRIRAIDAKLNEMFGYDAYVVDLYQGFVIYWNDGKLYKRDYSVAGDGSIKLSETATEVQRVAEYRDMNGTFVGNFTQKEKEMAKPKDDKKVELVSALISNADTEWAEEDKEELMKLTENALQKMQPKAKEPDKEEVVVNDDEDEEEEVVVNKETSKPKPKKRNTVKEYVENAPPEIQSYLKAGLRAHRDHKRKLVANIMSLEGNPFTEEELKNMDDEYLEKLSVMAENTARRKAADDEDDEDWLAANNDYSGAAPAASGVVDNADDEWMDEGPNWNSKD